LCGSYPDASTGGRSSDITSTGGRLFLEPLEVMRLRRLRRLLLVFDALDTKRRGSLRDFELAVGLPRVLGVSATTTQR
jgi:hypothetical protein